MSLQQLKSVIQAANLSIMELKQGCEYKDLKGDVLLFVRKNDTHVYGILNRAMTRNTFYSEYLDEIKILGRPIRLADVLLAIKTKYMLSSDLTDENNAILELLMPVYNYGKLVHEQYWDLANDSLDNQSPETLAFLAKLLCEN